MKRSVLVLIVVACLVVPAAALARPPAHPPIAGTWQTTDCAWYGDSAYDCTIWGDGSSITLTIGPGERPHLRWEDDYSQQCVDAGKGTSFVALGKGVYLTDPVDVHVVSSYTKSGCDKPKGGQPWYGELPIWWDAGNPDDPLDDTLWTDVPWDSTPLYGYIWRRVP